MKPVAALCCCLLAPLFAGALRQETSEVTFRPVELGPGVHVLEPTGKSSHRLTVAVHKGDALLCDASFARNEPAIRAALERLGVERIQFLVNTHYHSDHTDGNRALGHGATIIANARTRADLVAGRAPTPDPPLEDSALPTVTFEGELTVHFGGQAVSLIAYPGAHTDGDVVVHFAEARVVHVGDIMLAARTLPYTANVEALLACLDDLIDRLHPDTKVVPGHGALASVDDLRAFRAIITATSDYARDGLRAGRTPDQLIADMDPAWADWSTSYLSIEDWIRELCRTAQ